MENQILLSNQLRLIRIQNEDQPSLFALMDQVYKDPYRYVWEDEGDWYVNLIYNPQTLQKELSRSRTHYFFVEWRERKIGILKYDFPFSPREIEIPNAMKLHRLYLHKDAHGQGIAKALLDHCEIIAKQNHLESIWLESMDCQVQAKRFYEKMGFQKVLAYTLDFERIFPEYRQILILKKELK
ncbi:GNAT family N-acetyltransferase [Algoriphagus taiwanensis]|uniref:N-acetyltransferase domain-containing protein n=1 Tax=Algoriphagus taiwanensis TaxID=1445656 RepID=A0ABQ6Q2I0_9BACT|nr:hypothetical protein Ataiwa_26560 [Algoriphagus taiwanensis]